MTESFFGYAVTRKYPLRWFTWVVVFGGVAAAAILSVINLSANGYEPGVVTSSNPNETENPLQPQWFQKRPWSLAAKVSSKCQDQILLVGSRFYTNNFALSYTMTKIYQNNQPRVSVAYHNDYLRGCVINSISLSQGNNSATDLDVLAVIDCIVYENSNSGPVTITLELSAQTTIFNLEPRATDAVAGLPMFLSQDNATQATFWWASTFIGWNARMLGAYSVYSASYSYTTDTVSNMVSEFGLSPSPNFTRSAVVITRFEYGGTQHQAQFGSLTPGSPDELLDNDVWSTTYGIDELSKGWYFDNDFTARVNASDPRAFISLSLDGVGKSLYFTIMSDLGQLTDGNALTSPSRTMNFWTKTIELLHQQKIIGFDESLNGNSSDETPPTGLDDFFKWAGHAAPTVKPTTLLVQYICQVPKLKSMGSLILSVIVADVVFLQVLWQLLNLITTFFVEQRDPEATYCSGCLKIMQKTHDEDIEMTDLDGISVGHTDASATAFSSSVKRRTYEPIPVVISRASSIASASIRSSIHGDQDRIQDEESAAEDLMPTRQRTNTAD